MTAAEEKEKNLEDAMPVDEIKSQIKNVFSTVLEEEGEGTQQYDHNKANVWISKMCDQCLDKLIKMRKPYKFVVNAMIMRRNGAGMHVCSSAYYGPNDGCICEKYDVSAYLYCVITVYWCAI